MMVHQAEKGKGQKAEGVGESPRDRGDVSPAPSHFWEMLEELPMVRGFPG